VFLFVILFLAICFYSGMLDKNAQFTYKSENLCPRALLTKRYICLQVLNL